jgi:AraC-like DNA-binding protein
VPLTFGSDRNALVVDEYFLSIRLPTANRYLFAILSAHGDRLLRRLETPRSERDRVERHLLQVLHTGKASVTLVAREMGVSRQTLFRRLRAENVTFEEVLDALRHRMAVDYLRGKRTSVTETAYLLGFSEPAAFSRAFKRWTGVSPRNLRRAI